MREKVIVGLSGGVDSAAAAFLLRQQGYDVIGVTVRTWDSGGSRCCEIDAAAETAKALGIPYHVINCVSEFRRKVQDPFTEAWLQGLTPNPCVLCNPAVKWEWLLYAARLFRADRIATGHYARIVRKENGRFAVRQAADRKKDQSYMLYRLTQEQLEKTVFPLGEYTKTEIRRIAADAALPPAQAPDSREVCFITEGTCGDYLAVRAPVTLPDEGTIVDGEGRVLGRHRGFYRYTPGQRKGLGLSAGRPLYVKSVRPETNEVAVCEEAELWTGEAVCGCLCFSGVRGLDPGSEMRFRVRIRYRDAGTDARVTGAGNGTVRILFDTPVRAPAPGQSAVFYDAEGCIAGGGTLLRQSGDPEEGGEPDTGR